MNTSAFVLALSLFGSSMQTAVAADQVDFGMAMQAKVQAELDSKIWSQPAVQPEPEMSDLFEEYFAERKGDCVPQDKAS